MKVYSLKSAIKAFYFLTAIDGEIEEEELKQLDQIGNELDKDNFNKYRDEIIAECVSLIESAHGDYRYDIISHALDVSLGNGDCKEEIVVTPRLLVWNLLSIAYSNNQYDAEERRLIMHVSVVTGVEESILLEMENYIETAKAIEKEMKGLESLNRPYGEIKPIADELENRLLVIRESAQALIADEVPIDSPFVYQPDFFDKTKGAFDEKVKPVTKKVEETAKSIKGKINPIFSGLKNKTKDLINKNKSEEEK